MYESFAYIYDKLMYDINYKEWARYIESIFEANNYKPSLILDLGCGTGSFTIEMARKGYDMIGVDLSEDMLDCAKKKSDSEGMNILYLNQDMTQFELYGTVDVIVCLMDSLNYIIYKNDVKRMLKLVKNYLNPSGLFIFDVNTQYKFQNVFAQNVFYDVSDDVSYIWQNDYNAKSKICEFDLTFFANNGGSYDKYDEMHYERAYDETELKAMIDYAGLELLNTYEHLKLSKPKKKSERVFYVCRANK